MALGGWGTEVDLWGSQRLVRRKGGKKCVYVCLPKSMRLLVVFEVQGCKWGPRLKAEVSGLRVFQILSPYKTLCMLCICA